MRSKRIMRRWPGDQPETWEIIVSLIVMPELNYFCTLRTQMICKTKVSAARGHPRWRLWPEGRSMPPRVSLPLGGVQTPCSALPANPCARATKAQRGQLHRTPCSEPLHLMQTSLRWGKTPANIYTERCLEKDQRLHWKIPNLIWEWYLK